VLCDASWGILRACLFAVSSLSGGAWAKWRVSNGDVLCDVVSLFCDVVSLQCYDVKMREQVWVWVCELCGHRWIAVGIDPPVQCSKCKRRHWHTKQSEVGQHSAPQMTEAGNPPDQTKPSVSMDALRAICEGELPQHTEPEDPAPTSKPSRQCTHNEWSYELGEVLHCVLAEHGPKVKHRMVR
jgi:hypothetical protein